MSRGTRTDLLNFRGETMREGSINMLVVGLIDEIGGFEKALGCLSEKTGVPADTALVKMPRQDSWREQVTDVLGSIAGDIADRISSRSAHSFRYQLY